VRRGKALRLDERVEGETPGALEPALVAGARERLQEREAVPRRAVADPVPLLVAVRAGLPDQLGALEQELFVEILPGAGQDPGSSRAPLESDPAVGADELRTRRAGPVGEAALPKRGAGEHGRGLGG